MLAGCCKGASRRTFTKEQRRVEALDRHLRAVSAGEVHIPVPAHHLAQSAVMYRCHVQHSLCSKQGMHHRGHQQLQPASVAVFSLPGAIQLSPSSSCPPSLPFSFSSPSSPQEAQQVYVGRVNDFHLVHQSTQVHSPATHAAAGGLRVQWQGEAGSNEGKRRWGGR